MGMEQLHQDSNGMVGIRKRYIVVGPTRSGTTALHLLLAGHPHISVFTGELHFPRLAAGLRQFSVNGYVTDEEEHRARAALFDTVTGSVRTAETRALGAKTTVNAPKVAARFSEVMRNHFPDVNIIVPVRRDMVAHYGSRVKLRKTGIAHSWNEKGGSDTQEMVSIDRWLLANSVLVNMENYRVLRSVSQFTNCFEVDFEEFAQDNEGTYRRLLEFLELDYLNPDWLAAKRLHPSPESYIEGYNNLVSYAEDLKSAYTRNCLSYNYIYAIKLYAKAKSMIRARGSIKLGVTSSLNR